MIQRICKELQRRSSSQGGFTLIELLVVIVILAILSAVVVFAVRGAGDKGQSAATTADARTLRTAQEAFCARHGHYAATQEELVAGQFLSERSTLNDIGAATGPCGDGTTGPSGFAILNGNIPTEVRHTAGTTGYPSPFSYERGPGYMQMHYLYDTLLWKDASGNPIPWLAAAMPTVTNGGLTYTFDLRPNVKWHDFATTGQTLDANDVKFTFDYYKESIADGEISALVIAPPIQQITSVTVVDPDTVQFDLSAPAATFLQFGAAGAIPIAPEHIWSSIPDPRVPATSQDASKLVGTGPYTLATRANSSPNFDYTANDDYFLGSPKVRSVKYISQGAPTNNLPALASGNVDVASTPPTGISAAAINTWHNNPDFRVLQAPPGSSATQLNFNHAQAPFNNLSFRRAVAYALDRQAMVNTLFGGNGVPGNPGWVPPGHAVYEPGSQQYPHSVATANSLLDAAGYTPGAGGVRMTLPLTHTSDQDPTFVLVRDALSGVGITVTADVTTNINARIGAGTVGMYLISSGGLNSDLGADYPRLVYRTGATLIQRALNYSNPSLDTDLDAQHAELDETARKAILSDAQKTIADEVPLLILYYPHSYTIVKRSVFDKWYYTPGGVAGVVPNTSNKHVFVTGQQVGLPGTG